MKSDIARPNPIRLKIKEIENKKQKNKMFEEIRIKSNSIREDESAEKVMRYEKSLQKSIHQNLSVLKKLQSFS